MGEGLARPDGHPFEVRHSAGVQVRAQGAAEIAADAYVYFRPLFGGVEPDIALIVADEEDWRSRQPYGLPDLNEDKDQIRPGMLLIPVRSGDFRNTIADHLHQA